MHRDLMLGAVAGFVTVMLSYAVPGYVAGDSIAAVLPTGGAWYRALIVIAAYAVFAALVGRALDAWSAPSKKKR